jgi:hypothetical protein
MSFSALQTIQLYEPARVIDAQVTGLITLAEQGMASSVFGDRYGEAVGLKVLHILACLAINPSVSGPIVSESEGSLSRSYASPASGGGFDDLNTTAYGKQLIALKKSCIFSPVNRRM